MAHYDRRHRFNDGFTLVELIFGVALLSIVTVLGAPSMHSLLQRQRLTTATHTVIHHLALTRMNAVTKGRPAVLCPSVDGQRCSGGTDWSQGWLLFIDRGEERGLQPARIEDIVRVERNPFGGNLHLSTTSGRSRIRYMPDGRSVGSNLTFSLCSPKGELLTSVIVNNGGRARSTRPKQTTPCPTSRS